MPNPSEICVVTAGGFRYDIWETVDVTTSLDDQTCDHCLLTAAEPSDGASSLSQVKLQPGDPVSITLAGQTVMNGIVYLRQAAMDANSHAVQIGIISKFKEVIASTVDSAPGQYLNQTVQQIGSAVFGKVGVRFRVVGNPPGANKIFPRVSEHVGETRFSCVERLCRMRNLHLVDDGQNGAMAFRGPLGSADYSLKEGYSNILRARISLSNEEHADFTRILAQDFNQDTGDLNVKPTASATIAPLTGAPMGRSVKIACEEPTDAEGCQMRANHEADWIKYQNVDADITVQGWLNPNGKLFWNDRGKVIVVKSPTLLPNGSFGFMIKGVTHRQNSDEGTTTVISLCRADGKGVAADPTQLNPSIDELLAQQPNDL